MHKVVAVVVTYERLVLLKKCLKHLEQQTVACDVLVVNNASADGTGEWLSEYVKVHPAVYYESLPKNLGGAGGFYFGMRWAVQKGYPYTWLMDDDCLPQADALEKLMDADFLLGGPEQYGFLSSAVLWKDGCGCVMNRQKLTSRYYSNIRLMRHGLIEVEQATFVSLLVPRKTVLKVGLPIKEYFIWGDDIEYTRRIAVRNGCVGYLAGQSQVLHATGKNIGSSIAVDDIQKMERHQMAIRNERFTYFQENIRGIIHYFLRCGRSFFLVLFKAENHRLKRMSTLLHGMWQGLFFSPQIEYVGQQDGEKHFDDNE